MLWPGNQQNEIYGGRHCKKTGAVVNAAWQGQYLIEHSERLFMSGIVSYLWGIVSYNWTINQTNAGHKYLILINNSAMHWLIDHMDDDICSQSISYI